MRESLTKLRGSRIKSTKRLKPTFLILTLFISGIATAQSPPPTCDKVLDSCAKAVESQKQQVQIRDLRVQYQDEQIKATQEENAALKSENSAWYRAPWLWLTLGAVVGGYVSRH